jgi:hypothetical protein
MARSIAYEIFALLGFLPDFEARIRNFFATKTQRHKEVTKAV